MKLSLKTLYTALEPLDTGLLEKLDIHEESLYTQEILAQARKHQEERGFKNLTNTQAINLYEELNQQVRQGERLLLAAPSTHILNDYLRLKGLRDTPHYLAHLPRITEQQSKYPVFEQAMIFTDPAYVAFVAGIYEAPHGQVLINSRQRTRTGTLKEPVYTRLEEILNYDPS